MLLPICLDDILWTRSGHRIVATMILIRSLICVNAIHSILGNLSPVALMLDTRLLVEGPLESGALYSWLVEWYGLVGIEVNTSEFRGLGEWGLT